MRTAALALVALAGCSLPFADEPRCEPGLAPVYVTGTTVEDHYLRVDLEYGGGCEDHDYAVWWSGVLAPSDPPIVPLELQHYDHGDLCDALVPDTIWIDLAELHGVADRVLVDLVMGDGGAGQALARVDYTRAPLAPAPAPDVLAVDTSCGVIGP